MKNLVLAALHHSGTSAIRPILEQVTREYGYSVPKWNCDERFFKDIPQIARPLFYFTHQGPRQFSEYIKDPSFLFVHLRRDPCDVLVSYVMDDMFRHKVPEQHLHSMLLAYLNLNFVDHVSDAVAWLQIPSVMSITFDQIKSDLSDVCKQIFARAELDVDTQRLDAIIHEFSYETVTGRRRGERGLQLRNDVGMFRCGTTGEWKRYFDSEIIRKFNATVGPQTQLLGYGLCSEAVTENVEVFFSGESNSVMENLIRQRLEEIFPESLTYFASAVTDEKARAKIESAVAQLYFVGGEEQNEFFFAVHEFSSVLVDLEKNGVRINQLLAIHEDDFNDTIKSVVEEALVNHSEAGSLLHDILKSEGDTQLFIDCAKSFLLACILKQADAYVEIGQKREILLYSFRMQIEKLEFLQRFQLNRIYSAMSGFEKVVAFFCPDKAFRNNFGDLPRRLAEKKYGVLYLFGLSAGDDFESHETSFYVGGELILKVDCVNLYFTGTIMDALPDGAKKALIIHGSFAPFSPERYEKIEEVQGEEMLPFDEQYKRALAARSHFSAFFRLYDYYVVSSAYFHAAIVSVAKVYGLKPCGQLSDAPGPSHRHFKVFNDALQGRKIPERIHIVPAGYPQIDVNLEAATAYRGPKNIITYAPTPLNGKPVWNKYSSLYNAGLQIVEALLNAFPDYEIVFKPHIMDKNDQTMIVVENFSARAGFRVDWSGSKYIELYSKTAVLVSDFSSTAYTFALSTLSPVLFYSPNESMMPQSLRDEPYCRERERIGRVATTPEEMVSSIRLMLESATLYQEKIAVFRDENIYNVGCSEAYLCEAVEEMILGQKRDTWSCFTS